MRKIKLKKIVGTFIRQASKIAHEWNSHLEIVVVQFYPWFKFYLLLFLGMLIHDNEFETKGNKI